MPSFRTKGSQRGSEWMLVVVAVVGVIALCALAYRHTAGFGTNFHRERAISPSED
jgi:hypothetical protein